MSGSPLEVRPVFVVRRSPDWPALAAARARGTPVAPGLYVPEAEVPAFPAHIAHCIERWDATYRVNFFACRAELRAIAMATLEAVRGATVLAPADLPHRLPGGDYRLFFLDDDDWFAPDTTTRIACTGEEDVSVFPLLRLDAPVFTFVRHRTPHSPVIGLAGRFSHRYQTNNYGLHPRLCTPGRFAELADHIDASEAAGRLGLHDAYHDVLIGATNKSPVAASVIARLPGDEPGFRQHVANFVTALETLSLPDHAMWMREPARQTAALFARAIG